MYFRNTRRCQRGFSLVEIMVVIVIIGLLAAAVSVNVRGYLIKARQSTARKDIAVICQAIDSYWALNAKYPTVEEGLDILARPTPQQAEPFLKSPPIDPWGRPYRYALTGPAGSYEVTSLGADGQEGGTGGDEDISSRVIQQEGR